MLVLHYTYHQVGDCSSGQFSSDTKEQLSVSTVSTVTLHLSPGW